MTTNVQPSRCQFSLRGMLLLTTAVALLLLVGTRVGWIEAGGVAIAMVLAVVFVRLKGHREAWVLRPFVGIVAGVVLWGVGVDCSEFANSCHRCGLHWDDWQVRLFSIPLYSRSSPNGSEVPGLIASDLGLPCDHVFERHQLIRLWGLVYADPALCGTLGFSEVEWYFEPLREQMRALGRERPELAKEFHDRVILQRDYKYFHGFVVKFRTEHDPTYQPAPPPSNP